MASLAYFMRNCRCATLTTSIAVQGSGKRLKDVDKLALENTLSRRWSDAKRRGATGLSQVSA